VHFTRGAGLHTALPTLGAADPVKRAWQLTPDQVETFKWIFLQLLNEHSAERPQRAFAASAWLQLLLVTVHRWATRSSEPTITAPSSANAEVLRLWHLINESVSKPNDELADLYAAPNYDSVRHAFRKAFGCSPREMLQRLRMEHAKNLLLESSLSIKEIAARVGYVQQHDFNRMFHRYAGVAPSKWRANPLARSARM
jgi:transcriptional regulator GlxA family with amidase domain